jgi:hypothetical protein
VRKSREKGAGRVTPYDPIRPLAFLHIPKSSGTSVTSALNTALQSRSRIGMIDRCIFGEFADFESVSESARNCIVFDSTDLQSDLDFLAGHISFSTAARAYPGAQFMTLLREPLSRLISLWLFWRSHTDQSLEPWGTWADVVRKSRLPLKEFIRTRHIAGQTDNQCVRILLWPHPLIPDGDFIDEQHDETLVEEAMSRFKRFCFVDVLENPEFLINLERWLERPVMLPKLNVTDNMPQAMKRPMVDELDSETFALIESRSRLDLKLWSALIARRMPEIAPRVLRAQTITANLARYSRIMD